jgi:hypothetical protein
MFRPVANDTGDAPPDNGFNEVKIVSEFVFKFFNGLDSSLDDKTFKSLLRVANANGVK